MQIDYGDTEKRMTETEKKSIFSSVSTIAATPYGTAPYMRDMGIKKYLLSERTETIKNARASEIMEQIEMWDDRVSVKRVSFQGDEMMVMLEAKGESEDD
ncbi:MAG: hypothetical protein NC489_36575 [Ruminococcus flavefaciens]|nr:hypothetical protein [Ruminococcus flavefaciens]